MAKQEKRDESDTAAKKPAGSGDASEARPAPPAATGRSGSGAIVGALVGLGLLSAVGFIAYRVMKQPTLAETPCGRGAIALIGKLRSPVTVSLYVTPGIPKLDRFAGEVSATVRDLERSSNGKLVFKLVPITDADTAEQAKEAGLQETVFADEGAPPDAPIHRGFCGMGFSYGSEKEAIAYLAPESAQGLPFWIVGKIREIRARADQVATRFGIVKGKGGVSLSEPSLMPLQGGARGPNLKGIFEQAMPYYTLEDVDLKGGEAEIDDDYAGVLVLQADTDFTDKELRRIDEFLMLGKKSVVVLASAANVKASDTKMAVDLGAHGLDRLLDGYGIELQKDVLDDPAEDAAVSVALSTGAIKVRLPGILVLKHDDAAAPGAQALDTSFVPFFRLDEVIFPYASTLVLHPEKQPQARLFAVARSSPDAVSATAGPVSVKPVIAPELQGSKGQRIVAAALEGKIKSAFAGRPGDGVSAPDSAPESSRLFVLSASQFPLNPLARAANPPPPAPGMEVLGPTPPDEELAVMAQLYAQKYLTTTILAMKNTLDWASGDEATVACSALLLESTKAAQAK